ncbi:hypothetical protein X975_07876, partial [Stegodyphus mimosarum]
MYPTVPHVLAQYDDEECKLAIFILLSTSTQRCIHHDTTCRTRLHLKRQHVAIHVSTVMAHHITVRMPIFVAMSRERATALLQTSLHCSIRRVVLHMSQISDSGYVVWLYDTAKLRAQLSAIMIGQINGVTGKLKDNKSHLIQQNCAAHCEN